MRTSEKIEKAMEVFSFLMCRTIKGNFKFPEGERAQRCLIDWAEIFLLFYKNAESERIINYCIYHVHLISNYKDKHKWHVVNSFSKKAFRKFYNRKKGVAFYEDIWLAKYDLNRKQLYKQFLFFEEHGLYGYIYPSYEDGTKRRNIQEKDGYKRCQDPFFSYSLLWTPFSPVCQKCRNKGTCKDILIKKYPAIYEYRMKQVNRINSGECDDYFHY